MHPFRAAIENGASPEEFAALFASDVTSWPPITGSCQGIQPEERKTKQ